MLLSISPEKIIGFPKEEQVKLQKLIKVWHAHEIKNGQKNKYYEGRIRLSDVNLGIALPDGLRGLEIGCAWGAKTVDVLAGRSIFDGFVGSNGNEVEILDEIVNDENRS